MTGSLRGTGHVLLPKNLTPSGSGVGPIVQQWATAGQTLVDSTENTITYDDPTAPGFGAGQFFDTAMLCDFSTGITTIDADSAGYWEWDASCRVQWTATPGIQIVATIYKNTDVINRSRFDLSVSTGDVGDEVSVIVPIAGVDLVDGDEITFQVQTITDGTDANADKAFIHGRRIGPTQNQDSGAT